MNFGARRCGAWAVFLLLTLGLAASPAFAALQVGFTQQSPSLSIGESGTWRVTVTNPDPTPVNNPTLVVTLPLDFTVTSAGGGIESIGPPHTLTWTLPAVAANGGTQTVTFQARPNCNAETGQDITAQVNPPGGASALSAPITVKPPLITVTLVDTLGSTVTNGSVGDTVTWVLSVENTGTGDLVQGANISFTLGSAFTFLSIGSSTGNNTPGSLTPGAPVLWNTGLIAAGAQALYQIQAVISGCNPVELINEVAMNWTDGSTPCLSQPKTTSNSVALIIREPQVDIIPNDPSPIGYCDGSEASITITNLNAEGPANLFELEIARLAGQLGGDADHVGGDLQRCHQHLRGPPQHCPRREPGAHISH